MNITFNQVKKTVIKSSIAIACKYEGVFVKMLADDIRSCEITDEAEIMKTATRLIHYDNILMRFKNFCNGDEESIAHNDLIELVDFYQEITFLYSDEQTTDEINHFSDLLIKLTK